jgi:hypothetical protein
LALPLPNQLPLFLSSRAEDQVLPLTKNAESEPLLPLMLPLLLRGLDVVEPVVQASTTNPPVPGSNTAW